MGRAGTASERKIDRGRLAGSRQQSLYDLDRPLYRAVPLQLDASILSARRGARAELGRHWPPDLQPELLRSRLRRSGRTLRRGSRQDEGRWLVVARCCGHEQNHPPPDPQGNADKKTAAVNRSRLSVAYPFTRA